MEKNRYFAFVLTILLMFLLVGCFDEEVNPDDSVSNNVSKYGTAKYGTAKYGAAK